MSDNIECERTCDGCGKMLCAILCSSQSTLKTELLRLSVEMERKKWVTVSRGRFLPNAHYCPPCSNKATKPIPKKDMRKEMKA